MVDEYLARFKHELVRRNLTTKNYGECVKAFLNFAKKIKPESKDRRERFIEVAKAWVSRLQFRCAAEKTINLHIAALKRFAELVLGFTIKKEELPRLKEPKKIPEPLSREEIEKIFAVENNKKHLLIMQVAYFGGLRLGDIQTLRVKNLRYERGLIHIERGKGMKDRLVPFPDTIHQAMREHCQNKNGDDLVFTSQQTGEMYSKRTIEMIFQNACRRVEIQGKTNPHRFRHSFGAHMVQAGVNLRIIQESMGHSNSKTTEIYTRVAASDIAAVRNALCEG